MPRKPSVDNVILKEALKCYPAIFNVEGEIKSASDPVWRDVCSHSSFQKKASETGELSQSVFKPQQIHDYIQQNRHGLQTFLRLEFRLTSSQTEDTMQESSSNSSSVDEDSSDSCSVESQGKKPTVLWQVSVPYEQYLEIEPNTVIYREGSCKKRRRTLKKNAWSTTVADVFHKQHGVPCVFSFKRNKVRISNDQTTKFITAVGKCKECKAAVYVSAEEEPDVGNPLILHIRAPDTRSIVHLKKSQLRGEKRRKVGDEMLKTLPCNWRREILNKEITFGEKEPPNIPSLRVCRDARQEAIHRKFGTPTLKDPVLSLAEMKSTPKYAGDIHTISYDSFFVHYWSKEQIYIYKRYCSKHSFSKIEVDATGSLVQKLKRANGLSSHIFLYEIVINYENTQLSVSQMLSECQDTPSITFWLEKWLKNVHKSPKECVCDFSLALLGALCRALNDCSLNIYLKKCTTILLGFNTEKLACYIRVDVAHLIKTVCRWKCYPKKAKLVRKFYIRCVGLMISCASFDILKHLVLSTLILSRCETTGEITKGKTSKYETSKLYLCHCIETGDFEIIDAYGDKQDDDEELNDEEERNSQPLSKWLNDIVQEADETSREQGDQPNPYFCAGFSHKLLHLMKYFPIWTSVMQPVFRSPNKTASSASVEGDFGLLKNAILQHNQKPIRVDKFVACHLAALTGSCKIAAAVPIPKISSPKAKFMDDVIYEFVQNKPLEEEKEASPQLHVLKDTTQLLKEPTSETNNVEENVLELIEEECWRGKNKKPYVSECNSQRKNDVISQIPNFKDSAAPLNKPFKKRQTYLTPFPSITQIIDKPSSRKPLGILRNGSVLNTIKLKNDIYKLNNTCPFDSLLHSLSSIYIDYDLYRNFVDICQNPFLDFVKYFVENGPNQNVYKQRAQLLLAIYPCVQIPGGIVILNAEDYIGNTIQLYLKNVPSAVETSVCQNAACKNNHEHCSVFWPINTNDLKHGFAYAMQSSSKIINRPCSPTCGQRTTIMSSPGPHLIIEPRVGLPLTKQFLYEFPSEITISDIHYVLGAVIMHVQGCHYVSYCRRKTNVWEEYNDMNYSVKTVDPKKVCGLSEVVIYVKV